MGRKVEILAPAGSTESLRAAVCAGADAVYIGGARFGARAYAKNLSEDELLDAIDYVHIHGRRIYLTVNTLLKDPEMDQLYAYLRPYYLRGLDGVIVQDIGVLDYLRNYFPGIAIHGSTQMTITGADGAALMKEKGITRIVPARELSLDEIRQMKEETGLEIECFVHGALCYCYSGQCLLSSMIGGRSGNRGQCAQPCRLPYSVEGKKAADLMSLKDLCAIDLLPELIRAGIDSFKIEGRMKQPEYVYTVTRLYRKYADLCLKEGSGPYRVSEDDKNRLFEAYQRRGYTQGYYKRHNGRDMISWKRPSAGEGGYARHREELCFEGERRAGCPIEDTEYKIKEKINGNLILSQGSRAKLILSLGRHRAECEGETVQAAVRRPLEADRVKRQMQKTGNTEYELDQFQVLMDGEVFLPVQALNELRRDGIRKLTECILREHYRYEYDGEIYGNRDSIPGRPSEEERERTAGPFGKNRGISLAAAVQSEEQLKAAADCGYVDAVYVEEGVPLSVRMRPGCRLYLAMPYIFRAKEARSWEESYDRIRTLYDGVLIRNWESFQWLRRHGFEKEIRSDHNLYVFNRYGRKFMENAGISRFTAPLELNARELQKLDISGEVLSVYGCQPVMVTANCMEKTRGRCRREEGYLWIRDRYQKQFAVRRCCPYCYNIVYNSVPLFLADKAEEICRLAPGEVRLDFTTETAGEMSRIMELYIDAFIRRRDVAPPKTDYTRGHFKRGVK